MTARSCNKKLRTPLNFSGKRDAMDARDEMIPATKIFEMVGLNEQSGKNLLYRVNARRAPRDSLPPMTKIGHKLFCFNSVLEAWMARRSAAARAELDGGEKGPHRGRPRSQ